MVYFRNAVDGTETIDQPPLPPFVQKYYNPMFSNIWLFAYLPISPGMSLEEAMLAGKTWLDKTQYSGHLHWHDDSRHPINRRGWVDFGTYRFSLK